MSKEHRIQVKELPMAKDGMIWTKNKVGLDYNTKHKINIHGSILILANNWVHKWMEEGRICPAEEFRVFYVDTLPLGKWGINRPP